MRSRLIIILTLFSFSAFGQSVIGKYNDHFGHQLEFKQDSTFKFEWRFDLIHTWATGSWTIEDNIIRLNFINIYDTLIRVHTSDSLVLSIDENSNRISEKEFAMTQLSSGGQNNDGITHTLLVRRKKIYLIDNSGKILRDKQSGIWLKKKFPTWYFKED